MDRVSWFGTPVTVPLPVTVIRPAVCDEVRVAALAAGVPLDALLPSWVPIVNAPISSAAAATPVAAARYLGGGVLMAMRVLLLRGVLLDDRCYLARAEFDHFDLAVTAVYGYSLR